jgi:hypothetical protein
MSGETLRQLEQLAELGIGLIPAAGVSSHFLFERGGYVVVVERRESGFGRVGSPGKLVEGHGFAALVRSGSGEWFVAKDGRWPASPEEAEGARQLFTQLKAILESQTAPETS